MGGTCRVRLLGGFDVEVDRRPVPAAAWRSDGAGELVMLLALEPAHRMTKAQVIDRLWPTAAPREAQKRLDRAVRDTCRALHDGNAITVEGERIRLWPLGELWVDAHAFAARAKHAILPEQRAQASALYRGDLLPRVEEAWTEPYRTRLRMVHLELLRDPESGTPTWIDLREPVFSATI